MPEMITRKSWEKSWEKMGLNLKAEERCHVCLIAIESRKLAQLMCGMKALMAYQMNR